MSMRTRGDSWKRIGGAWRLLALSLVMALWVLAPFHSGVARAANFDVHEGDDLNIIVVTDEIVAGDDEAFLDAVEHATGRGHPAMVVLASPGGALGAGMHMGLIIAETGLPTFVPDGEVCASACALAWLAGAPRMMTGASEIGFHQPYDERDGQMVPSIEANAVVGHYIATIGMGPQIVSFAVSAPPDQMGWLDLALAAEIGLEVTEVSSEVSPMPRAVAGVDRRVAPTDGAFVGTAAVPVPVMRALTPVEVASIDLTGFVDATTDAAGAGLPLVTALRTDDAPVPFGLRVHVAHGAGPAFGHGDDPHELEGPAFDVMDGGEAEGAAYDDAYDAPLALGTVERAALDALHLYGSTGSDGLVEGSADCWRDMRAEPTVDRLRYCHALDLVAATLATPDATLDFSGFAIGVRVRTHRAMVKGDAIPADFETVWRDDAALVVAAMQAH